MVVSYTTDPAVHNGSAFMAQGLQTAAGVPLQCDEPADFKTFRLVKIRDAGNEYYYTVEEEQK